MPIGTTTLNHMWSHAETPIDNVATLQWGVNRWQLYIIFGQFRNWTQFSKSLVLWSNYLFKCDLEPCCVGPLQKSSVYIWNIGSKPRSKSSLSPLQLTAFQNQYSNTSYDDFPDSVSNYPSSLAQLLHIILECAAMRKCLLVSMSFPSIHNDRCYVRNLKKVSIESISSYFFFFP